MRPSKGKVALLISSYLPNLGGMEVGLHNIALELLEQGMEPIVIAPWTHVRQLKRLGWQLPYKVEAMPPKIWSLLAFSSTLGFKLLDWWFAHLDKKHQFEFWHVTMAYPTGCGIVHYAETAKHDVKYLIRCAGEDIQKNKEIGYGLRLDLKLDKMISYYLKRAKRLVAITDSVYQEYLELGIAEECIRRVPNGIPLRRFNQLRASSTARSDFGFSDDDFILLCVGRNHPKKNYEALIGALAECLKLGTFKPKLMCVGKDVSKLQGLVTEFGVSQHVKLIEEVGSAGADPNGLEFPSDKLIEIYKMCDLFVFPSKMETFGIAIVEAMAGGLPVIVGDSEGCRDIVEGGKWGRMVPPDDVKQLAQIITQMYCDPDLYAKFQKKSLERCKAFSWEQVVRLYLEIYQEASELAKESVS